MDDEITAVSIVVVHVTPKESGVFFYAGANDNSRIFSDLC
jgi:hypothetical protein